MYLTKPTFFKPLCDLIFYVWNIAAFYLSLFLIFCTIVSFSLFQQDLHRVFLFVCLHYTYEDVIFTGEELKILTYSEYSEPLSTDGSLACHTYCETGHPFIMVIPEDP